MSSFQQPQQPITAYPVTGGGQILPPTSLYGNYPSDGGSYMTVYVILAVIFIVCSIACCFGRFYGRRFDKLKPSSPKKAAVLPQEKDSNIEFGFDYKKIRTANRPVRYGDFGGHKPALKAGETNHGNKENFDHNGPTITFSVV